MQVISGQLNATHSSRYLQLSQAERGQGILLRFHYKTTTGFEVQQHEVGRS